MKALHTSRGFTIIEVMLFLAVGGLLTVGILAGSGAMISQQRYKDAAVRLQSSLQQLYTNTENTLNIHTGKGWKCGADGVVSYDASITTDWRGGSECEVVGRFLEFTNGGKTIVTSSVTGYRNATQPEPDTDLQAFGQYKLAWTQADRQEASTPWGVAVTRPGGGVADMTILVLRSPLSGGLYTFVSSDYHPSASENPIPASVVSAFNTETMLCINPGGLVITETLGVVIKAGAGGQSAIEQRSSGSGC